MTIQRASFDSARTGAPVDQPTTFGDELRRLRQASEMTQEELAERAGVSARTITDLERGIVQHPRRDTVNLLTGAMGLTDDEREALWRLRKRREPRQASSRSPAFFVPVYSNRLIGRESEMAALANAILEPDARIVTVTGPGGVGKTRLAVELATELESWFPGGVVFVDLTRHREPGAMIDQIARALDLGDSPATGNIDRVITVLERNRTLVLLDNFEHLLSSAPDIGRIFMMTPHSRALVTSRARLQVQAEREFRVAAFARPDRAGPVDQDVALSFPGVQLFADRARLANPEFELNPENVSPILEICTHLDGLPLAIELAAARCNVLSPAEIASRLHQRLNVLTHGFQDVPDRHRTMRDAINWSYELLDDETQHLFRHLSVFVGGWTIEGAEAVVRGHSDVLASLTSLLENSLTFRTEDRAGESRYSMLETIREFGLERLNALGEMSQARESHARFVRELVERAEPELRGPDPKPWLDLIERELPNVRQALDWAAEPAVDPGFGLELSAALSWYWLRLQADVSEGRRLLTRALERSPDRSVPRMKALAGVVWIAHMQHDLDSARSLGQEALAIARETGDAWYEAWLVHLLGRVAYFDDNARTAYDLAIESLEIARRSGDDWLIAWSYQLLGIACFIGGDLSAARTHLETGLSVWTKLNDRPGMAALYALLGVVYRLEGDDSTALLYLQESLSRYQGLDARWFAANFVAEIVAIGVRRGELERAAILSGFVDEVWSRIGAGPAPFTRDEYEHATALISGEFSVETHDELRSKGSRLAPYDAIDVALTVGTDSSA